MSQIKGKQVQAASTTVSGVLTAAAQTIFGNKLLDTLAAATTRILGLKNNLGTQEFYLNNATPEGVITAAIGSVCTDVANGNTYIKASGAGNTGWIPFARETVGLKAAATNVTAGVLQYATDSKELYVGNGAAVDRVGPFVYNTAGVISRPKIWVGTVTSTAGTGAFTCTFTGVTFTTAPVVTLTCISTGVTTNLQARASLTAAPTTASCTGLVVVPRNAAVGVSTVAFPAAAVTVQVTAIGIGT